MRFGYILILIFCTIHISRLHGNENYPAGSCAAAMGNAAVVSKGFWSSFHNQAGLASLENLTFGIHHENRFGVPEFGLQAFGLAMPTKPGTLGFNISYFGFSRYNEVKAGLLFGRYLSEIFAVGIQLNYLHTHISNLYGNTSTLTVEVGFIAEPHPGFFIGAHLYNPTRAKIKTFYDQPVPTILRFGFGYNFGDRAVLNIETEKDLDRKVVLKGGTEVKVLDNFVIRAGLSGNPVLSSFGLGYVFKNLSADLAFSNHQILGLTPHFSLTYALK
jgi:hypothetical protein